MLFNHFECSNRFFKVRAQEAFINPKARRAPERAPIPDRIVKQVEKKLENKSPSETNPPLGTFA